ncbi:MAG: Gfo/Idh/MocA family oxidoreductase [Candidatus Sericytochromatia bacterium]|uniref:Gfo/Idh/MocA family oxidoreductase n=1 Tax=Candidatus Tanganyikabacteria bacterium TaxID=2961651 RepID=A0A937X2Y9_9BACT|nr:Gfo/Idh/MocA family oxidoreductase [Candidatus Tanganyikabacteria bacterium]
MAGVGNIARLHALGYKNAPNAELHALCDVNKALLRQRQVEWGVQKTYDSFEKMLADPDVDAIDIITPHHLHKDMAIAALEAGKHVSLQKPMANSIAECDAIIDAVDRTGQFFRTWLFRR